LGSIKDWDKLYRQAYRCLKPGGWIEHHDNSAKWEGEDKPVPDDSAIGQWHKVFWKSGEMMGQTFRILEEDIQRTGMAKAGFVNLDYNDLKCPFGGWPRDKKMKTIGQMHQLVFEEDPEGWLLYLWSSVLGWSHDSIRVYVKQARRQMNTDRMYIKHRVVWAQKPEEK